MAGIVEYMEKQRGLPSKEKDSLKSIQTAMHKREDVLVVGFFESDKDEAYSHYQDSG